MLTEKLRRGFPGISALFTSIIGALRGLHAYYKALKSMKVLEIKDPANAWIWKVSERSMLSYSDARYIYTHLYNYSTAYMLTPKRITTFIIDMANSGHSRDMIMLYLKQIDKKEK